MNKIKTCYVQLTLTTLPSTDRRRLTGEPSASAIETVGTCRKVLTTISSTTKADVLNIYIKTYCIVYSVPGYKLLGTHKY